MKYDEIYKVGREDYKSFVHTIKPECRDVKVEENDIFIETMVCSKSSGKLLCSRISYAEAARKPEEYYIINMPDDSERDAPIPKMKLKLETKEEVQAFFDFMTKIKNSEKEKK